MWMNIQKKHAHNWKGNEYLGKTKTMNNGMNATITEYISCEDINVQFEDDIIIKHTTILKFNKGTIEHPTNNKYVGLSNIMSNGMKATIVAYRSDRDIDVQFEDGTLISHKRLSNFNNCSIHHPNTNYESLYINCINDKFNYEKFLKMIDLDLLEFGISKKFILEIDHIITVYGYNEEQITKLYNSSINSYGFVNIYSLNRNAILEAYHRQSCKFDIEKAKTFLYYENIEVSKLTNYFNEITPYEIIFHMTNKWNYDVLLTIDEIFSQIDLPKGVLNCMIIFILKKNNKILPPVSYFKKVSETWKKDNIFSTEDALYYTIKKLKTKQKEVNKMFKGTIQDYEFDTDLVIVNFPKVLEVIKCDVFISMNNNARILYFYLLFHSKKGICSCTQSLIKMLGASMEDYQMLLDNRFIGINNANEVIILNYEDRFEYDE